ncbi:MAG: GNAT family N-acetyltransferase [Planctomycetota bacterium]|jgi:GNAT superfamily N-acetyltransferase
MENKRCDRPIPADANVEFRRVSAPLAPETAWVIESLLLKIFEYGDYSLRSALAGRYSDTLNCTFSLASYQGETIGAGACLYDHKNPTISTVGPVGVAARYRRNGIGTKLIKSLINHLRHRGCKVVYLGVSLDSPAARLYEAVGFKRYKGVVMRLLFCPQAQFEEQYFGQTADLKCRRAEWGDYPAIEALASFPCNIYTYDFRRSVFSSEYVQPTRFLSIFPEMSKALDRHGGYANVLVTGQNENVVGIAHIERLASKAQQHVAVLDFYVHDSFVPQATTLVSKTIQESAELPVEKTNCYCLACDKTKRNVIEALDAKRIAVLPANTRINGNYEDVLVYQLGATR